MVLYVMFKYTLRHTHTHTHPQVYTHAYTSIYTHTYTSTHTHIHIWAILYIYEIKFIWTQSFVASTKDRVM